MQLYSPKRIVPPKFLILFCSSIIAIIGLHVLSLNSSELASVSFRTFLAYSITDNCIPRQIPKKGIFFSLAYLIAIIIPSIPLEPKPPGTTIALYFFKMLITFFSVIVSESTTSTLTLTLFLYPACFKLSITEIYASSNLIYLPTKQTVISSLILLILLIIFSHSLLLGTKLDNFK